MGGPLANIQIPVNRENEVDDVDEEVAAANVGVGDMNAAVACGVDAATVHPKSLPTFVGGGFLN